MRASIVVFFLLFTVGVLGGQASAEEAARSEWPKEITRPKAVITIYQPQVESYEGARLKARAAVSVAQNGGAPLFGAIWIEANVDSDRGERLATLRDVEVPRVRFAESEESEQEQLAQIIEDAVPPSGLSISLDLLIADMDPADAKHVDAELKHDAPKMLYRTTPTILISLDGKPIFQKVEDHRGVERVLNTPFTLLRSKGNLYLSAGAGLWYQAKDLEGPWEAGVKPPAGVAALEPKDAKVDAASDAKNPPEVLVVTEPSELIVSDGAPTWTPVAGADLLYLDNSDGDVFLEVATQRYFVLLSGRWYAGRAIDKQWEWEHVANDALPKSFANIPVDSANGHVLPMVSGTPQARDAVLDNTIPQTAAVKRQGGEPLTIQYDGKPRFEKIDGIPASYAVNTPSAVFDVGKHYWACEQGIWYDAGSATGPWKVSTEVPEVLYRIPASNPHYNVTYVKVYQTTPEVVYVGYTPAYLGSYVYAGSVVYGTGWYYAPWYGRYYYPRYPTWGFNVSYNPWTGWGFGVTWHNGPFSFSFGYGGSWFGPVGYRPWGRPYVGGGFRKTDIDIDRSINVGDVNIDRSKRADINRNVNNVYDRGNNKDRVVQRPSTRPETRPTTRPEARPATRPEARPGDRPDIGRGDLARPADRPNNVLADRDGNVYRRDQSGSWDQRTNRDWSKAQNLDRPSNIDRSSRGQSATRPQLERSHQARQYGASRSTSFQNHRARGGGGGGRRGGGRR